MVDSYVGEIRMFGGNYAPDDWHVCDGTLLAIADYNALYALIGTLYGGDGVTNFALPDMRGLVPIGTGQGSGLTNRPLASKGGSTSVTLSNSQMPAHTHALNALNIAATTNQVVANNMLATTNGTNKLYGTANDLTLSNQALGLAGGGLAHENMMPSLSINYIICLNGLFPTTN